MVCREFGCLPSAAERELDEHFERVMDVLWTRMYARVKSEVDAAKRNEDIPVGLMADLVQETKVEIWLERRLKRDA